MTETDLSVRETKTEVSAYTPEQVAAANIDTQENIPDLRTSAKKHFVPLSIEYWSPQEEGEEKLVYVHGVGYHEIQDMETGELKSERCVMLLEQKDGALLRFISASRVLVGNIDDAINRGEIVPKTVLTPISIKYLGKKKNRTNSRMSARWQITPLIIEGEQS